MTDVLAKRQFELEEIHKRLAGMESALQKLVDLLTQDLADDDRVAGEVHGPTLRRDMLPPALLRRSRQLHTLKIRVMRAAKHHGIEYSEWVRLHGQRDRRFPPGVDPTAPTKPGKRPRKKTKTTRLR